MQKDAETIVQLLASGTPLIPSDLAYVLGDRDQVETIGSRLDLQTRNALDSLQFSRRAGPGGAGEPEAILVQAKRFMQDALGTSE